MEENFTMEAYRSANQQKHQVSDQRGMLPHSKLRAMFNDLSSTHSSPTEVSSQFESYREGFDYLYLALQRVASQRLARGNKRPALSSKIRSPPRTLKAETKTKGKATAVPSARNSQVKPPQTKHLNSFEARAKRPKRVLYTESDSSDSEEEYQQEEPKTEMDAIREASGVIQCYHILLIALVTGIECHSRRQFERPSMFRLRHFTPFQ